MADPRRGSCVPPRSAPCAPISNTACLRATRPTRIGTLRLSSNADIPAVAAPSSSPCRATRLRLRQFMCRTGSMPACRSSNAVSNGEPSGRSPGLSVTWIASTKSLRRRARAIRAAGSGDGASSAVKASDVERTAACRPIIAAERERGRRRVGATCKRRAGQRRRGRCLRGRGWRPRRENTGGPSTMCHKRKGR